jgi:8-hydroxy-5-deazaflavin:NADPH oxidoreductase
MRVAILGGTGKFGRALARRLADKGDDVVIGSREAERARTIATDVGVAGAVNEDAIAGADLVVLACDASAALATARALRSAIGGTPLLCVASELQVKGVRSLAEQVAEAIDAPVAAGLHTVAAGTIGREQDALVCGDDADTKALALELAGKAVEGRAYDAGPLANARALEGLTGVLVAVNKRYKVHAGIRLSDV